LEDLSLVLPVQGGPLGRQRVVVETVRRNKSMSDGTIWNREVGF
jgi:hypothetical protein